MVSRFRKRRERKKKDDAQAPRAQRKRTRSVEKRIANGSAVVVDEVGGVCGRDIACDRDAGSVLAGICELAREIPARIAGGAAASVAADGTWILRARGHGPARAAGKTVDRAIRPWTGVHVQRTDSGVPAVQFPVCGAATGRFTANGKLYRDRKSTRL